MTANIAVLIPCYNEEASIGKVIQDFQNYLPNAKIYVYDNNSKDKTASIAESFGVIVRTEVLQGKGHVVRRMFADIDADFYIMIDGDGTYDIPSSEKMLKLLQKQQLDMVVGTRVPVDGAHRPGHSLGNKIFNQILKFTFGSYFSDIFSGYRVFSRRFVKSFPCLSYGFDIETEISVHCLSLCLPCREIPTPFYERLPGGESKLRTFQDGFKILRRIISLLTSFRPFFFFGNISLLFAVIAFILSIPIFVQYIHSGLVPKLPTAVLVTGMMIISFLNMYVGIILNGISLQKREKMRLFYLQNSINVFY